MRPLELCLVRTAQEVSTSIRTGAEGLEYGEARLWGCRSTVYVNNQILGTRHCSSIVCRCAGTQHSNTAEDWGQAKLGTGGSMHTSRERRAAMQGTVLIHWEQFGVPDPGTQCSRHTITSPSR